MRNFEILTNIAPHFAAIRSNSKDQQTVAPVVRIVLRYPRTASHLSLRVLEDLRIEVHHILSRNCENGKMGLLSEAYFLQIRLKIIDVKGIRFIMNLNNWLVTWRVFLRVPVVHDERRGHENRRHTDVNKK